MTGTGRPGDGTAPAGTRPGQEPSAAQVRDAVRTGHARLLALVSDLTDDQAREASALPGWTRAHVLTHLGDLARALTRQTRAALAGELVEVYDGGRPARDAAIEAGAARPAAALVADLAAACRELDAAWSPLEDAHWALPCRYRDADLRAVLLCQWREVAIHTSDLALGVTPRDWSPQLCAHLLTHLAPRAPQGTRLVLDAGRPGLTWSCGTGDALTVSGHLNDLTAWMAGRPVPGPSRCTAGDLPALGPWP